MSLSHSPNIVTNGLILYYDMANTQKSWLGAPTNNRVYTTPIPPTVYAYATGPVATNTSGPDYNTISVGRYTITSAINTARAAIYVPNGSMALSTPYTFSCVWRYNGTNTSTPTFEINASKGNPEGSGSNSFSNLVQTNTALTNGWTYSTLQFTLSASPTLGCYLTYGIVTGSTSTFVGNTFDVYNIQFEQNSFATPFVAGIRSTTQAILDLTNNNTITATSLTYASNNTFSFNGSGNVVDCGTGGVLTLGNNAPFSIGAWIKCSALKTYAGILSKVVANRGGTYSFMACLHNDGRLAFYNNASWFFSSNVGLTTNTWYYVNFVYNGSGTLTYYVNGIAAGTSSLTWPENIAHKVFVGSWYSVNTVYDFNGQIVNVNLYNRSLSAEEVAQNFQAMRSRYGI